MRYKALIIDDNKGMCEGLKVLFSSENISLITAEDGETGIALANSKKPDVIILDLSLPDMDGDEVQKTLKNDKATSHIPVIILTGTQMTDQNQADGINMGACDYILKPFDNKVLIARVKNVFRWQEYKGEVKEKMIKCGLEMDEETKTVKVKGKPINLTLKEFDLLFTLVRKIGQILKYDYLLYTVWGYEKDIYIHTLINHICSLKKKLGPDCAKKIKTIKHVGYKFEEE